MTQHMTSLIHTHNIDYVYRSATNSDIEPIIALVHAAYRGESSRRGWTTEAELLDGTRTDAQEISAIINAPHNLILLCEHTNKLLASVHLQQQADSCYLGMFAVHPDAQNSGIGKTLLAHAETTAQQLWQSQRMQMTVITLRTELIAWYQRRGYQRTGIYKPFPYGIARYGKPRRNDLMLEVLEKQW